MTEELKIFLFVSSFVLICALSNVLYDITESETLLLVVGFSVIMLTTLSPEIIEKLAPEKKKGGYNK